MFSSAYDKDDPKETFAIVATLQRFSSSVSGRPPVCQTTCPSGCRVQTRHHGFCPTKYSCAPVLHLTSFLSLTHGLALLKRLTASTIKAFSACVRYRYGNLINAVELVEQGHGIFWSQFPLPLDKVVASGDTGKELAGGFFQLSSLLGAHVGFPPNAEPQYEGACDLNRRLQEVVTDIHNWPGLSRFLQPPLFSDLRSQLLTDSSSSSTPANTAVMGRSLFLAETDRAFVVPDH